MPDAAASTASRPNVRDDGQRPSSGRDGGGYSFDLPDGLSGIFLLQGLDSQITDLPVRQEMACSHGQRIARWRALASNRDQVHRYIPKARGKLSALSP
jgi:hypothetical protein